MYFICTAGLLSCRPGKDKEQHVLLMNALGYALPRADHYLLQAAFSPTYAADCYALGLWQCSVGVRVKDCHCGCESTGLDRREDVSPSESRQKLTAMRHETATKTWPWKSHAKQRQKRSESTLQGGGERHNKVLRKKKKDARDSGVAERNAKRLQMGREAYSWFAAPTGLAAFFFYAPVPRGPFSSPPTAGPERRRHRHITQWQVTLEMHSSPSSSASLKQAKTQNSHFLPAVGSITVFCLDRLCLCPWCDEKCWISAISGVRHYTHTH